MTMLITILEKNHNGVKLTWSLTLAPRICLESFKIVEATNQKSHKPKKASMKVGGKFKYFGQVANATRFDVLDQNGQGEHSEPDVIDLENIESIQKQSYK